MTQTITINDRDYTGLPTSTAIVVCLDGSQKEYFEEASKLNLTPNLDKIINTGENLLANSAIPSFTNPNNISIVTGRPSSVHGICGNFFYTPSTGEEVMMNDPQYLRAPTIFQKYYERGAKIAIVTAKDKLRMLLSHGLNLNDGRAICFSSEKSDQATISENGIDKINDCGIGIIGEHRLLPMVVDTNFLSTFKCLTISKITMITKALCFELLAKFSR